jgi:hypothetical protein
VLAALRGLSALRGQIRRLISVIEALEFQVATLEKEIPALIPETGAVANRGDCGYPHTKDWAPLGQGEAGSVVIGPSRERRVRCTIDGLSINLTAALADLLRALCAGAGSGPDGLGRFVPCAELAHALRSRSGPLSCGTLKVRLHRLRAALSRAGVQSLVETGRGGAGLRFRARAFRALPDPK